MPNIKQAKKRARKSEEQRVKNQAFKSSMRTAIKEFDKKVEADDIEGAKNVFVLAEQKLDKAAQKGLIHKNTAARKKSQLERKLNQAQATAS
ncbi:30S ribosomal protein S20 [Natribacillus halophilus]|uniref:Small ribosomal subunit protein bS20 n=1 Tax=Natribacillus halophilus TaxID=549003 RepID=A0A1G8JU02_9BACI|nr:30S ribosomal protein S20 [Natribacillus halophilus]SDI34577.1 small subunit ribosomal protein S20 [Natribacillus halophilus]